MSVCAVVSMFLSKFTHQCAINKRLLPEDKNMHLAFLSNRLHNMKKDFVIFSMSSKDKECDIDSTSTFLEHGLRMVTVFPCWSVGPCLRTSFSEKMYALVILDEDDCSYGKFASSYWTWLGLLSIQQNSSKLLSRLQKLIVLYVECLSRRVLNPNSSAHWHQYGLNRLYREIW